MYSTIGVTSSQGNYYLYDFLKKEFMPCHPLIHLCYQLDEKEMLESLPKTIDESGHVLTEKYDQDTIEYYRNRYLSLKMRNYFSYIYKEPFAKYSAQSVMESISNINDVVFEVTDGCNLKCKYCINGCLYNTHPSTENRQMSFDAVKSTLDYLHPLWSSDLNKSSHQEITVGFYGGEPLINFSLIKKSVEYCNSLKLENHSFKYNMTTNATLLDKYIDFLVENDFRITISLDGTEWGQSYRTFHNGKNSFEKVYSVLKEIQKAHPDFWEEKISFNSVLHNRNTVAETHQFIYEEFGKIPEIHLMNDSYLKSKVLCSKTDKIESIVRPLLELDNLYGIGLCDSDLKDDGISNLISDPRQQYMADLLPFTEVNPVVIPPVMKCHADQRSEMQETEVMPLLNTLTFYLNGTCQQECVHCKDYLHQFSFCYKNNEELDFAKVKDLLHKVLVTTPTLKLNFNGGNIFRYTQINELLAHLHQTQTKSNIYVHYLNWDFSFYNQLTLCNIFTHIDVIFPVDWNLIKDISIQHKDRPERIKFRFVVENEEEFEILQYKIEELGLEKFSVVPFYNGHNISFFEKCIYIREDDLSEDMPDKRDIYKRQLINLNDMGKLFISSDGQYFSNMNFPALGRTTEHITQIISKEWNKGKVWKRTRKEKPCTECVYQYLCPSPSNYELVMNKPNLCNIKE